MSIADSLNTNTGDSPFSGSFSQLAKPIKIKDTQTIPSHKINEELLTDNTVYLKVFGYPPSADSEVFSFLQGLASIKTANFRDKMCIEISVADRTSANALLAFNGATFKGLHSTFLIGVVEYDGKTDQHTKPVNKIDYDVPYCEIPAEFAEKKRSFVSSLFFGK